MNAISSDPDAPKDWKDLWENHREVWSPSACEEIENFIRRKAWELHPRSWLAGRKPTKCKWVLRKKAESDGSIRLKSRIVILGYMQIPGVDYTESFSPVANDVTIRIAMVITLSKKGWRIDVVDIEAAFLNADLDEVIYVEWPEGVLELGYVTEEITKKYCIRSRKAMYGIAQAPRAFFLTFSKFLRSTGMTQSKLDPCLWFMHSDDDELVLMVVVYVDDCAVCGTDEMINWWKEKVKTRFNISDLGPIKKHIGVWYEEGEDEQGRYYELSMNNYCEDLIKRTRGVVWYHQKS
jgi:Reverse transcriptase (RNA-dependent DNA polymerase).